MRQEINYAWQATEIMNESLFYGGDIPGNGKTSGPDKNKAYDWVTTRLIREEKDYGINN